MADLEKFRNETRAWLAANCPPDMRLPFEDEDDRYWGGRNAAFKSDGAAPLVRTDGGARLDRAGMAEGIWRRRALARGSEGPAQRDAPPRLPLAADSFGIWMLGPALLRYGSEAQKREYLPQIARGEIRWCQGYSEPNAGSDLASLATRPKTAATIFSSTARRSGRATPTRPTGSSVWYGPIRRRQSISASASFSSTCARPACRPSRSCSFPASRRSARPSSTTCGCPKEQVVGELNKGWEVAKYLLTHEREMISAIGLGAGRPLGQVAADALGSEARHARRYVPARRHCALRGRQRRPFSSRWSGPATFSKPSRPVRPSPRCSNITAPN